MNVDAMVARNVAESDADEVGLDRNFAAAAIHQHRHANDARPAKVGQQVQCAAGRATGEDHVVDQKQGFAVDRDVERGRLHQRPRADFGQVVAIQRDVEHASAELLVAGGLQ
jgi:hypothetical protein